MEHPARELLRKMALEEHEKQDQTRLAGELTLKEVQRERGELPRAAQALPLREAAAAAVGVRVTDWRERARYDLPEWCATYGGHIADPAAKALLERFGDLVAACATRWKIGPNDRVLYTDVEAVAKELNLLPQTPAARKTGERPISRGEMVRRHKDRWSTIESDLGAVSKAGFEGLKAARAAPRGWYESVAVAWARAIGKYRDKADKPKQPAAWYQLP